MDILQNDDNYEAVRSLFELFAPRVLAAAFFIVRDHNLAEDILQETFLTAMRKLDQLKDPEKAGAWLTRIAVNKAHTEMRKKKRQVSLKLPVAGGDDTGEAVLLRDETESVQRAIDRLEREYQLVLYLKYYREMSVKAIATVLEIPEGTVKSRLRRARELVNGYLCREAGF